MAEPGEFSVYWDDPEGYSHAEQRWVNAESAVKCAQSLTRRPATLLGVIRRIIITDSGDNTVFEWRLGKGITFP